MSEKKSEGDFWISTRLNLASNLSEAQQVDEKAIVEKAQALQNKLAEF